MGVDRTDYLMFGVKVDPEKVSEKYDELQAMIEGAPGAPFDLVYDGMSGEYAVAGKIIAQSSPYDGLDFTEITDALLPKDVTALAAAIGQHFDSVGTLRLYLFTHFS